MILRTKAGLELVNLKEFFDNQSSSPLFPWKSSYLATERMARMLKKANGLLNLVGYKLVIYTAYRSPAEQAECRGRAVVKLIKEGLAPEEAEIKAKQLVADPEKSFHCQGKAVDVGLAQIDSNEPLKLHERNLPHCEQARFDCAQVPPEKRLLRLGLRQIMTSIGFEAIEKEFWHFNAPTVL